MTDGAGERTEKKPVVWLVAGGVALLLICAGSAVAVTALVGRARAIASAAAVARAHEKDSAKMGAVAGAFVADLLADRVDAAWQVTSASYRESVTRAQFDRDAKGLRERLESGSGGSPDLWEFRTERTDDRPGTGCVKRTQQFEKGRADTEIHLVEDRGAPDEWLVTSWKIEPSK